MAETSQILLPESFQGGRGDFTEQIWLIWELIKAPLIVPVLRLMVYISLAMSLMLFFERLYMGVVIILVKLFWKKPEKRYKYEPIQDDLELGSSNFPHVLIQIPMFNEREVLILISPSPVFCLDRTFSHQINRVLKSLALCLLQVYKISIGAACGLSWPADRLVIQVLDDSTDPVIKVL